jgi:hypothetical protein
VSAFPIVNTYCLGAVLPAFFLSKYTLIYILIRQKGSRNAQCAFNTCIGGFCSGFKNSTTIKSCSSSASGTPVTSIATTANISTVPFVSGNSSVVTQPSQPSNTSPILASDGTKLRRSLVVLLGVATILALAL